MAVNWSGKDQYSTVYYMLIYLTSLCMTCRNLNHKVFSHTRSYRIETFLCLVADGKIDLTWLLMGTSVDIFETIYIRRLTSYVPNYRMTSVRFVCDVGFCNSDPKSQTSIAPMSVNKNIKCGYAIS